MLEILLSSPMFIINGKRLAIDIGEHCGLDIKSDEVQWFLNRIESFLEIILTHFIFNNNLLLIDFFRLFKKYLTVLPLIHNINF